MTSSISGGGVRCRTYDAATITDGIGAPGGLYLDVDTGQQLPIADFDLPAGMTDIPSEDSLYSILDFGGGWQNVYLDLVPGSEANDITDYPVSEDAVSAVVQNLASLF